MGKNLEIELKLRLPDPAAGATLFQGTWLKKLLLPGSAAEETLEAIYYDTPQRELGAAGFAFRVRREGGCWMATLKGSGRSGGGLHQRREWNLPVQGPEGATAALRQLLATGQGGILADQELVLAPLFQTVFTRWSALLRPREGDAVLEIALDRGRICCGEKSEIIEELEIELKEGSARDLVAFGAELARRLPLLPEWKSKYYRGLRLAGLGGEEEPAAANAPAESSELFFAEAVESVLRAQLAYFEAPASVEAMHALRVALRKLRTGLSFAGPLYPATEVDARKGVLQRWSRTLAAVRELDVLQEEWLLAVPHCGIDREKSLLQALLQEKRNKASLAVTNQIAKGKLTADLLAFWSWSAGAGGAAAEEWQAYCRRRLRRWLNRLQARLRDSAAENLAELHKLRIQGKKVRYMVELLAHNRGGRALAVELKQLQECLGDIQDAGQARVSLVQLRQGQRPAGLAVEQAYLAGWQARRGYNGIYSLKERRQHWRKAIKQWLKDTDE